MHGNGSEFRGGLECGDTYAELLAWQCSGMVYCYFLGQFV